MAMLAIKGHATRGKEVIEILEMLGGKNITNYDGSNTKSFYFLNNIIICSSYGSGKLLGIDCYTLEQFLEKFPYKVGDKVYYDNKVCDVIEMLWNSNLNTISYGVYDGKIKSLAIAEELKSYKEETMEEIKIDIPNGYEFFGIDDDNKIVLTKQQPQYPKTYDECCELLKKTKSYQSVSGYKTELLEDFQKLLICRDAYWKIAGVEMGLDKPWKPKSTEMSHAIVCRDDGDFLLHRRTRAILIFPSAEMRDMFYDNFKELIEQCK
jgi:hypothetical protein